MLVRGISEVVTTELAMVALVIDTNYKEVSQQYDLNDLKYIQSWIIAFQPCYLVEREHFLDYCFLKAKWLKSIILIVISLFPLLKLACKGLLIEIIEQPRQRGS